MKLLNWIGDHPFLTFFVLCIVRDIIIGVAKVKYGY